MNTRYSHKQRQQLLSIVIKSIQHGITFGERYQNDHSNTEAFTQEQRACFVTLKTNNTLRGCVGSLVANEALINNIIHNAYSAAFNDSRFVPLRRKELPGLSIQLSILSPSETLQFSSQQELLNQLIPNRDGLIISEGEKHATFLPSVWQDLNEAQEFLNHLKIKAGLPQDYWSTTIEAKRYTTESFACTLTPEDIS